MKKTVSLCFVCCMSFHILFAQAAKEVITDQLIAKAPDKSPKNLDLAAAYLTEIIDNTPNSYAAILERATVYYEDNKFNKAVADFTRYLAQDPDNMEVLAMCGSARLQTGDAAGATQDFTKILTTTPTADIYLQRAIAYKLQEKYNLALSDIEQYIHIKPSKVEGYNYKADILYHLRKYEEALVAYTASIELKKNDPITYYNRANAYMKVDESDKAIADYTIAYQLAPNPAILVGRASAYLQSEKLEAALEDCLAALKVDADIADAYNCIGVVATRRGNMEEAYAAFERAVELDTHFAAAFNNYGLARHNTGNFSEALALFNKSIVADIQHEAAYTNRGTTKYILGDIEGAIDDQRKCLSINPDNPYANSRLATYLAAHKGKGEPAAIEKLTPNLKKNAVETTHN
jgi:tetratricopeptide (TPR) repeat protein